MLKKYITFKKCKFIYGLYCIVYKGGKKTKKLKNITIPQKQRVAFKSA